MPDDSIFIKVRRSYEINMKKFHMWRKWYAKTENKDYDLNFVKKFN